MTPTIAQCKQVNVTTNRTRHHAILVLCATFLLLMTQCFAVRLSSPVTQRNPRACCAQSAKIPQDHCKEICLKASCEARRQSRAYQAATSYVTFVRACYTEQCSVAWVSREKSVTLIVSMENRYKTEAINNSRICDEGKSWEK